MREWAEAGDDLHLDDGRCADLTLRLVPREARERALAHAAGCAACEERLRRHASAAERARADRPRRALIAEGRERSFWHPGPRWALAAAAVLAVALAAPFLRPRPLVAPTTLWLPAPGEEVRTRDNEVEDPHLASGLAAYEARDLATADRELSMARTSGAADLLRRLYLAHVRLARGDARGSLLMLRGLDWRLVPEPWRRQGEDVLVRALRANGRAAAADSIERALRDRDPGSPFVP